MTKIERIQEILEVKRDGEWGPECQTALNKEIRQSQEDGKPIVPLAPGKHPFVVVANEWMGVKETSANRFPGDKKLWADTNYPDGWEDRAKYCAATICHWVAEAKRRGAKVTDLPTSPSVSELRNWARRHGYMVKVPQAGDVGTLLPSGTSHIFLVAANNGATVETREGNTDASGSREGDGFWPKSRRIAACDFFRIPVE